MRAGGSKSRRGGVDHAFNVRYSNAMARIDPQQFTIDIARLTADFKCDNVVALDLRQISTVTDYTVICTGTSERQIRGVADRVLEFGKSVGDRPFGFCGYDSARWVVVDFVNVVLHIFTPAYRSYYDLELLWGDAPRLEWESLPSDQPAAP
jgi:ribosome-associated protein